MYKLYYISEPGGHRFMRLVSAGVEEDGLIAEARAKSWLMTGGNAIEPNPGVSAIFSRVGRK